MWRGRSRGRVELALYQARVNAFRPTNDALIVPLTTASLMGGIASIRRPTSGLERFQIELTVSKRLARGDLAPAHCRPPEVRTK